MGETNDLIYEGIATCPHRVKKLRFPTETNDLIYEGIATNLMVSQSACVFETNDLIYEGIATTGAAYHAHDIVEGNKRPDLRRDCDVQKYFISPHNPPETNDLIYEGIATASIVHQCT